MSENMPAPPHAARSTARLAAVQALYQMDIAATGAKTVIAEFAQHRFGHEVDGQHYDEADLAFFEDLLLGVVREQTAIDPVIARHLAEGWRLSRLDSILRAILRAGAYELMFRPDIPIKVAINEYLEVAHAFFEGGEEPAVVNGVLDKIARTARQREAAGADDGAR